MEIAPPQTSSRLESLPNELTVKILSSSPSFSDLVALIRASPILYAAFLSAKPAVLTSVVSNSLGPAGLRDAVAIVKTPLLDPESEQYAEEAERAIRQYEALPRDVRWGHGVPANVTALVDLERVIRFFVDEYASAVFPLLRKLDPDFAYPLSTTERHRLSQAFLRYQLMVRIDTRRHPWHTTNEDRLVRDWIFALFKPWELQMVAQAGALVYTLAVSSFYAVNCHVPSPQHANLPLELAPLQRVVGHIRADASTEAYAALGEDTKNLRTHEDGGMMEDMTWKLEHLHWIQDPFPWLQEGVAGSPCSDGLAVLIRFTDEQKAAISEERAQLYSHEDSMSRLSRPQGLFGCSPPVSDIPFAWLDGLDGLDCQRWGDDLWRRPATPETDKQQHWFTQKLVKWRRLGFMFWDEDRVEMLKRHFPVFATGWLNKSPPPDEECDYEMDYWAYVRSEGR